MGVYIKGIEMPTSCYDCRFHEVYSYKDGEKRVCELNWEVLFGDEWGKNFKHPDCPLVEVPKWIPVTERLPEYGEKCLVFFKLHSHNDYYIGVSYCYVQKEGFWSDCGRDYKVTHWMPLPQLPESEGEKCASNTISVDV